MLNMTTNTDTNSIPFLQYMTEQEAARQQGEKASPSQTPYQTHTPPFPDYPTNNTSKEAKAH